MLRSCCCGMFSLRTGSYASAIYTLGYFLVFALLTGNYSYHEMTSSQPPSSTIPNNNRTLLGSLEQNDPQSATLPTEISPGEASPFGEVTLLLLDFSCEISGFFVSIMLIRGLELENKCYLIPWLVVVPLHTLIDSLSLANIVIGSRKEGQRNGQRDLVGLFLTLAFVILDLILNVINVYVFVVVYAQYQEYRHGRGTAAYRTWVETTIIREVVTDPVEPHPPHHPYKTNSSDTSLQQIQQAEVKGHHLLTQPPTMRSKQLLSSPSLPLGRITAV